MERKKSPKKIAIIGAGLCGLAAAWHLSSRCDADITVFDENGVGGGTSGIAAGLLHPYVGAQNKLSDQGHEGLAATKALIAVAEEASATSIAEFNGLLRLASDAQQLQDYTKAAKIYDDVEWRTAEENEKFVDGLQPLPGIFIKNAGVVDTMAYLQGLWSACNRNGVTLLKEKMTSLQQLDGYDVVVIAAGAGCKTIQGLEGVALNLVKGQVLTCSWPQDLRVLPCALNCYAYLIKGANPALCVAGATYEHHFEDWLPHREFAVNEILPKVQKYFPSITEQNVLEVRAGMRASAPDRKPILRRVTDRCWVLAGMGSKGLLYHALYAKLLADEIMG